MPYDACSRDPSNPEITVAEVIDRTAAADALGARRQQDLRSALRTLCRVLGKETTQIIADPGALRRRMNELGPAIPGISPARWRNIRSLVLRGLQAAGIKVTPTRSSRPLSPEWRRLFDNLPDRTTRFGLARFIRFCDENGVAPEAVTDTVMDRFRDMLLREGVCSRPKSVHRTACQVWNRVAVSNAAWPKTTLAIPNYRREVALPEADFPPAFIGEKNAFLADYAGADRLGIGDRLARLGRRLRRPVTVYNKGIQIMQLAGALVRRGHPAEAMSLSYIVEHAEDALRFFLDRLPKGETSGQVSHLAIALKQIGQYLKVDEAKMGLLRGYCRGLAPDDSGMSERKRDRLRQFDDAGNLITLLRLPERVRKEVSRKACPTRADAEVMEMAVAVELLLMKPMRIRSLSLIEERHITRTRAGRDGVTHIAVPNTNVKNAVGFEVALPRPSADLLQLHMTRYRPLLGSDTSWLFPGKNGEAKRPGALGSKIQRFIKRRTGLIVPPHLIRSIAGVIILNRNPGAYEDVRQVLGNKTLSIIVKYYCGEETKAALRRYDEMILGIRAEGDPEPGRPRRRRP